ncbi:MAG: hypothetical protein D6719_04660 [Candidatus Dadabacteria bacterium]|nr:MAG: hypothetical protein D6719_04660 [Candidatus Dadabacteria bacterium]
MTKLKYSFSQQVGAIHFFGLIGFVVFLILVVLFFRQIETIQTNKEQIRYLYQRVNKLEARMDRIAP